MWTRSHLHAFPKVPPFSSSDCASLFALNEASRFEFDIGANFASFGKMLPKYLQVLHSLTDGLWLPDAKLHTTSASTFTSG